MDFNFGALAETSFVTNTNSYLKAFDIYEVNLTKFERSSLNGKDGVNTYPVITIEFGNDTGIFSENLFIPTKDEDFVRRENETSHKLMPSRFDQFQFTIMQIVETLNPQDAQKIKNSASKLKTIDDFVKVTTQALEKVKNVKCFLKLIGKVSNGTWYARLPNSCIINGDGKCVPIRFVSLDRNDLKFSPYEVGKMQEFQKAKPTNMDSVDDSKSDGGLDLNDIQL